MDSEIVPISIIVIMTMLKKRRMRREKLKAKRTLWSQKWLLRRGSGRGFTSLAMNELLLEDPDSFKNFVRMSHKSFFILLDKVSPLIEKQNTQMREAISPTSRLLITLRYLATGEKFRQMSYGFRVSQAAITSIVPETLQAIYTVLKNDYLKVPQEASDWKTISDEFEQKWNFPHCLGAIDGKHIAIRARKDYGSYYYNYKCFNSIILLAIVDANYKFIYVNVGTNGRAHDSAAFNESSFCEGLLKNQFDLPEESELPGTTDKVPYVFVADEAFRLGPRILKPYGERSVNANKVFNYRLSRARRVVENAFGILANKFQIFQREIHLPVEKIEILTFAACALHNFIRTEEGIEPNLIDIENTKSVQIHSGLWRNSVHITGLQKNFGNRSGEEGRKIRDKFAKYFNTVGSVPWQLEAIQKFNF